MKFYAAYGSNLNLHQMKQRCPSAKLISAGILCGWELCFRGVADIVPSKSTTVPVGVYKTTPACECSLDVYEDHPKLYRKQDVSVQIEEELFDCFVYVMNPGFGLGPPSGCYFDTIQEGYDNWKLSYTPLIKGLRLAFENSEKHTVMTKSWGQHNALDRLEADNRLNLLEKHSNTTYVI